MTIQHADGMTCMADFWEQSAKLLQKRVEQDEQIIEDLWAMLPEPPPLRPEFKARLDALLELGGVNVRTNGESTQNTTDQHEGYGEKK